MNSGAPSFDNAGGYARFCQFLQDRSGIVLGDNKQYLVTSRLSSLLKEQNIRDLSELVDRLQRGPSHLLQSVIDAMTTNETMWFRDGYPFEAIKNLVFAQHTTASPVTIWCAACSSGQEPYSIAITADEFKSEMRGKLFPGVRIVATDISSAMLNASRDGVYESLAVARGLSEERKRKYFQEMPEGRWRIKDNLRASISFQPMNLLQFPYNVGPFDIIFCRNVLIYFSPQVKSQVLNALTARLKKGGILFLGGSESLGDMSEKYELMRCNPGIAYRLK